jgi:hypothetical protein
MDPTKIGRFFFREQKLPEELKYIVEAKRVSNHFRILMEMEAEFITDMLKEPGAHAYAPESIVQRNLCGYSAAAITEELRNRLVQGRIVYGHKKKEGVATYHYWTEAITDGNKRTEIDADYTSQLTLQSKDKILIYPCEDLPKYNLEEFRGDAGSEFILPTDGTSAFLKDNDGMLPIREEIKNPRILALYEELVRNFS